MGAVGLITVVLLHVFFLSVCVVGKDEEYHQKKCSPSSCGDIRNISYPFRLKGDPPNCGYPDYELICENNRTMINLQDGGKYYGKYLVTKINYHNSTIGVVDPGLVKKHNCWISSPLHSNIAAYYTHYVATRPYYLPDYEWAIAYPSSPFKPIFYTIVLMKCEELVSHYDYIPIIPCNTTTTTGYYSSSSSSSSPTYVYALVGDYTLVEDIPNSCTIGTSMVIQQLKPFPNPRIFPCQICKIICFPGFSFHFWITSATTIAK